MTRGHRIGKDHLDKLLSKFSEAEIAERLQPKDHLPLPRVPGGSLINAAALKKRWDLLSISEEQRSLLCDFSQAETLKAYGKNIENFIGTITLPVGLAGPLRINGMFAQNDYYIPLATTEAALVASYHRGALLITAAGGCSCALLSEGVSRAPGFCFKSLMNAGSFIRWCLIHMEQFRTVAEATTRHGKLNDMRITVDGNHVYLIFEYSTGDAAGQNMVTIATEAILKYIIEKTPVKPEHYFIEANLSGDKKASTQSFQSVRGKKVSAEIKISKELIVKYLHTTPEKMAKYWNISALGGVLSGTIGVQGHYANGLAALYLACGQDVACVAESAVGVTRLEVTSDGGLYACVTLPNLIVGTVGGGTGLPTQKACLEIMGLAGSGHARALAEVCAGLALAGELSIKGAICSHEFTRAHQRLARKPLK